MTYKVCFIKSQAEYNKIVFFYKNNMPKYTCNFLLNY